MCQCTFYLKTYFVHISVFEHHLEIKQWKVTEVCNINTIYLYKYWDMYQSYISKHYLWISNYILKSKRLYAIFFSASFIKRC